NPPHIGGYTIFSTFYCLISTGHLSARGFLFGRTWEKAGTNAGPYYRILQTEYGDGFFTRNAGFPSALLAFKWIRGTGSRTSRSTRSTVSISTAPNPPVKQNPNSFFARITRKSTSSRYSS